MDVRRGKIQFEFDDWFYLKISPMKGLMRFLKKVELRLGYVGLYQILKCFCKLAYDLDFPSKLVSVHLEFHVLMLKSVLVIILRLCLCLKNSKQNNLFCYGGRKE